MKQFACALLLTVAIDAKKTKPEPTPTPAPAPKPAPKPKVDPYLNDPVDLRPLLIAAGGFYNGLITGAFGKGAAPQDCLEKEFASSVQGLIHVAFKGDFNNVTKIISEGTEIIGSVKNCEFNENLSEFYFHCTETDECDIEKIQDRLSKNLMKIISPAQDMISTLSEIKLDEDLNLLQQDFEHVGKDFGDLLDLVFKY